MDGAEAEHDAQFRGGIPEVYQRLLVPMIFEEPAESLARVVADLAPGDVLETAAGTGALTAALLRSCPGARITATDLNQPMLDAAAAAVPDPAVRWQQADALELPFDDQPFDVVACQFGAMFFPDRVRGYREAARVLRPGGSFVFTVWDRIETSEVPWVIHAALVTATPGHPVDFLSRTPHGYFHLPRIRDDLEEAGMPGATIRAVEGTSRTTPAEAARAFCQGTPLRVAIEHHESLKVEDATAIAEDALTRHFGPGPIEAPTRWIEVVARPSTAVRR
ncbi:class I SAM-dependent methyltransferase [Aeromicrobium sp. Marseille-Q0843]|uniref:Class I SAM-dependent methyltransferase n=1 Tax=Aeromicrobium phoceense TaxID=2754045 RepID=A0A838XGF7_9ACTN|nr:class I SAM-dependent methyltransferase [Aeromicrobium phoceense]MBA4608927.1 class I SAM-dependent methyltransferase [Aeromicrobium phoceense]